MDYSNSSTSSGNVIKVDFGEKKTDQFRTLPASKVSSFEDIEALKYYMLAQQMEKTLTKNSESKIEGDHMDNNDLLKAYMEKVDRDQSDLRADIKESERRTAEQMNRMEFRMDERLNKIEKIIENTHQEIATSNKTIDEKLEAFRSDIKEHKFFRITSAIGIIGVCLATIIGIAAMVVSISGTL